VASNQRERRGPAGLQRLALIAFASLLVLLFVGFAIAQGIGEPSVPDGDVAVIEDAPEGLGTITKEDLDHAIEQSAGQAGVKPVPKPGDPQYDELKETALGEAFDRIWIQGEAEEAGISVTPKEVSDELKKLIAQAFENKAQYQKFLKEAHFTAEDVDERVKVQILSEKLQKQTSEEVPQPSDEEVKEYYEASKASQFTEPETRDARAVRFKEKGEAEKAKAALEKDDSAATWKRLARKSTNASTKRTGGRLAGISDGQLPEPLNAAIFAAPPSQIEGPLKEQNGYTVFAVEKVVTEKVKPLAEVESQISNQLNEQAQQAASARFISNYSSKWRSRTFCGDDYTTERCANFKGSGRPPGAPPACYEADPKGGRPAACPAPVQQVAPALPGSVELLTPEGEKLAQRPHPAGEGAAAGGPTGEAGIPPVTPGE
jgi:parvulin-like peptidyl-prolyl isomerase